MRTSGLLLVFALVGCEHADPTATPAADGVIPALEVVAVVSEKLDTIARLPGELTAYEMVALYPRVSGFVEEMVVDRGARVHRGQVLVRLSAPEMIAQRTEVESGLVAAKSTLERTRAAAETPGAVAKHDLDLDDAAVKAGEARVRSVKALEDYLIVRAPFDGVITERNVHPGALVGPPAGAAAVPMLRMESVGHLRLTVAVPETDVGSIVEGAKPEFTVRAWPGQRFAGTIRRVAHAVDGRTRTMPVELDVDNAAGTLAPGMFAEVSWPIRRASPSLFVPVTAVVQTTEKTFVDRVQDGTIDQVTVQRGMTLKDRVEVFGALTAGEQVLSRGSEELKTGAKVAPKAATPDLGGAK